MLWFNLPRCPDAPEDIGTLFCFMPGGLLVFMEHGAQWQVGYIIAKGDFPRLRAAGIDALRDTLSAQLPAFATRFAQLQDWKQCALLSVESSRLRRWHAPGLLLLGDAAHVTSPIGGVGINLAIQDAVAAANTLAEPLKRGRLRQRHLWAVQARRDWQVRVVQFFQAIAHRQVAAAFDSTRPFTVSRPFRLWFSTPVARSLPAWLIACGVWPERVARTQNTEHRTKTKYVPPRFKGKYQ